MILSNNFADYLPQRKIYTATEFDHEADRVRRTLNCSLAAFVAVFDDEDVLLVQLGDYCKERFNGNPWTLPGGAVEATELPSDAAVRELKEETGVELSATDLIVAGWFARPYFKSWRGGTVGEVLLLYAAVGDHTTPLTFPSPEINGAIYYPFSLDSFLAVPAMGSGDHPLQPLPRHYAYWAALGFKAISDQLADPLVHVYETPDDLCRSPFPRMPDSQSSKTRRTEETEVLLVSK